jgi:hypothetical protein
VTYQLIRAVSGWPRKEYTLSEIEGKARRQRLVIRDGYGRTRIHQARKLMLSNGAVFRAIDDEQPAKPFGPRTPTDIK